MNEHEERMLDVALEEVLGGKAPTDLRSKVPGGGRRAAGLAVAAALLLCLGVLWAVFREGQPAQDPDKSKLTYRLVFPEDFKGDRGAAADQTRRVVERRLEERGAAGAKVIVEKGDRLVVRFSPADRAAFEDTGRLIRRPGRLELNAVAAKEIQERFNKDKTVPQGYKAIDVPAEQRMRRDAEYEPWSQPQILIQGTSIIEGKNVVRSGPRSELVPGGVRWVTGIELDADGAKKFDEAAKMLYHQQPSGMIAIVFDGELRSAPAVQSEKFGGHAVITGAVDEADARDLSIVLRSGALPVPLKQESERFVPPKK